MVVELVGDLVEGVVDVGVPEVGSRSGLDSGEVEVVHVATDAPGDFQVHRLFVRSDGDGVDLWRGFVDLRAAVSFLVDVGPCFGLVGLEVFGGSGIEGLGEGDDEAVRLGVHFVHFEGGLTRPADAFKVEVLSATSSPSAIGATDEEGGVFADAGGDGAAAEVFQEFPHGALIESFDFFEVNALYL